MKKFRNRLCAGLALLLVAMCFCGCGEKTDYNIFSELVSVEEDTILPRNVTYGQTLDAFKQARSLTDDDILDTRDGSILLPYTAEHIPYEIRERIRYTEDANEIYMVEYVIVVKEADAEKTFAAFYEQAKAALPEPAKDLPVENSLENMKTGESVQWQDKDGNTLTFSTSDVGDPDGEESQIAIQIAMRSGLYPRQHPGAEDNQS